MIEVANLPSPLILPLGDMSLLVRFGTTLSNDANEAAITFARRLRRALPQGVTEIDPNLVSVLLKYDPERIDFERLAGEVRLLLSEPEADDAVTPTTHYVSVAFGGNEGPDLDQAATTLGMTTDDFIAAHNANPLRVLTTGFAPGLALMRSQRAGSASIHSTSWFS